MIIAGAKSNGSQISIYISSPLQTPLETLLRHRGTHTDIVEKNSVKIVVA